MQNIALSIVLLYLALTLTCFVSYWLAGMTPFDAFAHALTTIATGGFSTYDLSIGFFRDPVIEWVAICFMLLASLPFLVLLQFQLGRPWGLLRDVQVRLFLTLVVIFVLLAWVAQKEPGSWPGAAEFQDAAFNVVSIITGTGYATSGFDAWGSFAAVLFLTIMFIGGCAGSTSCGIKVFRFFVIYETLKARVVKFTQPNRVVVSRFNGKPMTPEVGRAVMNFLFIYFFSFAVIASLLSSFQAID
ncbi:MAG: potassium transporter TrkG, partial [Pseudomonadota bacterium]